MEVKTYSDEFQVSKAVAEERLDVQSKGTEVDIVGELEQRLDENYAGVWFDNALGEFVVPLSPGASSGAVASELATADLDGSEFRTARVQSSWEELEAAQKKIDAGWSELVNSGALRTGIMRTGIDARTNSVVVRVSTEASDAENVEIKRLVTKAGVEVELRETNEERFDVSDSACDVANRVCDLPLRGGTFILVPGITSCSTGFSARDVAGNRYVLTAGHCIQEPGDPSPHWLWQTYDSVYQGGHEHTVGTAQQWHYPGNDWAKINVAGQWPNITPWPTQVAFWGQETPGYPWAQDLNYPIYGQGQSYIGQTVCHSGANTGGSCGIVVAMNETLEYGPGEKVHGLTMARGKYLCVGGGDSGGSVFAVNTAMGLLSGGGVWTECYDPKKALPEMGYTEILEATKELGVYIVPTMEDPPPPPPSWHFDNLGGYTYGNPDVASWGPERLDVFALGSDGKTMYHKWFNGYEGWSAWEPRTSGYSSSPGAVSWGYNRIDTVGRETNGSVAHEYFDGSWHKANIGGYILGEPDISAWPNRLDVFALGADGKTLFHRWFTVAEGWSGWETRTTGYSSGPSAVSWAEGRIDVVGRASDGSVAHEYWDGTWHKDNLGGYITGKPTISSWGPERLDVFALGADGKTMFHKWFTGAEGWSGWETRTGGYSAGPGAVSWGYNRIDVVGRATDGSVKHEYWSP